MDATAPHVEVPASHLLRGQAQHLLLLAALLPGPWWVAQGLGSGSWAGLEASRWLALGVAVVVVHQGMVAVVWRLQLATRWFSRLFGRWDLAVWGALFLPLLLARPVVVLGLGLADAGSLGLPGWARLGGALLLGLPALYALSSVMRFFGIPRALGGDHFYERYRAMPPVRQGAFAWTDNAMYGLAFLGLWAVALACDSVAALGLTLFHHAFIWVHYYCTEEPDMRLLYGASEP